MAARAEWPADRVNREAQWRDQNGESTVWTTSRFRASDIRARVSICGGAARLCTGTPAAANIDTAATKARPPTNAALEVFCLLNMSSPLVSSADGKCQR